MAGRIYALNGPNGLIPMEEAPYDSENVLQELLAKYPDLLAGEQIDSEEPRRWLLIRREMRVPAEEDGSGRWSLDHLFVDQDAIPTLIEVKRSSDTRIRREVVGQMLDYAANAVAYWPVEEFRSHFQRESEAAGVDPIEALARFLGPNANPDEFWQKAKTNLQAGRIRMVFVADEIPRELRRIVEFLNEQMDPAEILAVEIRQFVGSGIQTLVPRVIGQTAEAQRKKGAPREEHQWDEVTFFDEMKRRHGTDVSAVARKLYEHFRPIATRIWWGRGKVDGNLIPLFDDERGKQFLLAISTNGRMELQFGWMKSRAPFSDPALRKELLDKLNAVPRISLPADSVERFPRFDLRVLCNDQTYDGFLAAMDWAAHQIIDSRTSGSTT
jgi:hypothetical protein